MNKMIVTALAAATLAFGAGLTQASPASRTTPTGKTAVKLISVKTCPITGEKVVGNGAGSEVVGPYKVFFCCGGCQPQFDKLTSAQKLAKVKALAKKS